MPATRSLTPITEAGEDREELTALHAAVTADWRPRDAYERRWVMELVTAMRRQDRLQALEITTLTAAAEESPPTEATLKKLLTFARYGARIDKDIGRALQALRVLRDRPAACLEQPQDGTSEPAVPEPPPNRTHETPPLASKATPQPPAARTPEPGPRLNRHQRRALAAMERRRAA